LKVHKKTITSLAGKTLYEDLVSFWTLWQFVSFDSIW